MPRRSSFSPDASRLSRRRTRFCGRSSMTFMPPTWKERMMTAEARPRLAPKARLKYDRFSGRYLLLFPETGWLLNGTGMELLQLCDGRHTLGMILDVLARRYPHVHPD